MAVNQIPAADLAAATADDPQKMESLISNKIKQIHTEMHAADAARAAALAKSHLKFSIAHLTGTTTLVLSDAERLELKNYVDTGGTLIIDSAGGSTEFAVSAEQMLYKTFGEDAHQLATPLKIDAPIYQIKDHVIGEVAYRLFAQARLSNTKTPQLRGIKIGPRIAVFFSREDLSGGLVGQPVDGVTGYTPAAATSLMTNVILYAREASR